MSDINMGNISIPILIPEKGVDYWTEQDKQEVINEATVYVREVVEPQEIVRQANEATRIENETNRQEAETVRQSQEETRQSNETQRISNEETRQSNEGLRTVRFEEQMTLNENAIAQIQSNLDEYNANAEIKTGQYNDNAQSKVEAYNTNATEKIAEYDQHVSQISTQISNIEAEQTTQNTNIANNTQNIQANTTAIQGLQSKITSSNKLASDLVDDTNQTNKFVTASEKTTWGAKYDKPAGGIPKTDLASDVQTSLGKADTAIQDISGKQDLLTAGANIQISNNVVSATDTTYSNATDETAGLMSATDKSKLDGIEAQANKTVVDNTLSSTSENPVQNKVIYASQEVQNTKIETLEADVEDLRNASMKVSGSGSNFKLSNTAKAKFLELLMGGNTEQEGTPAPDNECLIYNVTGNVNNKIQNKNLFNKNTVTNNYWLLTDGTLVVHSGFVTSDYIEVNPSTSYYLTNTRTRRFKYYDTNKNAITNNWDLANAGEQTFTTPATAKYIRLCVDTALISIDTVQLEQGSTATQYVEHQEQNLPFTLASGQKMYQGSYLADNGIHHKRKQVTFSGTTITLLDAKTNGAYVCSKKAAGNLSGQTLTFDEEVTNAIIEYELANEEIIPYNVTQQTQYNAILQVYSYKDETNISSTSDGVGMKIEATAVVDANKIISDINTRLEALESEV